ncbi:hypothetical protein SNE40_016043 [Patella caerulea]|uniref:tRNA-binding domain-containing protein n=2 Tax=Patella caerulea TaxID=87958 RepID=A0AAN8J821_PATCE
MLIRVIRMASETVLQRLKQKAELAEKITVELNSKIEQLKTAAVQANSKGDEDQLKKENAVLKAEIEEIKRQITLAEINNGVKQVFLPNHTPTAPLVNGIVNEIKESSPAPANKPEVNKNKKQDNTAKQASNDQPKEGKPAKESKPKKEGKPKAAPAADEKMDISRLDLRIGKIINVKKHPDADSLYVEDVDVGEEKIRTVVSGLVKHIPLDQMQNRVAVFMCNLKPVKMRGILSEGMIMCASTPEKVEILVPPTGVVVGEKVTFKDFQGVPDTQLNPKKKIWETLKPDVRTNNQCVAMFRGCPFTVEGKGEVKAPTLADAQIS